MMTTLPTRDALKAHAKRLRADLLGAGTDISHSKALELVAHQWGARDWNTLSARLETPAELGWYPGQTVHGRYLGHDFKGVIKAADHRAKGFWRVTIRFDAPIDVVRSDKFTALRHQVTATLGPNGQSFEKTSDGTPHMVLLRDPA